jgi:hypothetical protein
MEITSIDRSTIDIHRGTTGGSPQPPDTGPAATPTGFSNTDSYSGPSGADTAAATAPATSAAPDGSLPLPPQGTRVDTRVQLPDGTTIQGRFQATRAIPTPGREQDFVTVTFEGSISREKSGAASNGIFDLEGSAGAGVKVTYTADIPKSEYEQGKLPDPFNAAEWTPGTTMTISSQAFTALGGTAAFRGLGITGTVNASAGLAFGIEKADANTVRLYAGTQAAVESELSTSVKLGPLRVGLANERTFTNYNLRFAEVHLRDASAREGLGTLIGNTLTFGAIEGGPGIRTGSIDQQRYTDHDRIYAELSWRGNGARLGLELGNVVADYTRRSYDDGEVQESFVVKGGRAAVEVTRKNGEVTGTTAYFRNLSFSEADYITDAFGSPRPTPGSRGYDLQINLPGGGWDVLRYRANQAAEDRPFLTPAHAGLARAQSAEELAAAFFLTDPGTLPELLLSFAAPPLGRYPHVGWVTTRPR